MLSSQNTIFNVMNNNFCDMNQQADQCMIQKVEFIFSIRSESLQNHMNFEKKQI